MSRNRLAGMQLLPSKKRAETSFRLRESDLRLRNYLSMPAVVSGRVMSTSTMIPPAAIVVIVARVPMPIPAVAIIAMAVVAGTEAEVNRRRFDDYSRLGIIDRGRCIIGLGCVITDRRSWRTI